MIGCTAKAEPDRVDQFQGCKITWTLDGLQSDVLDEAREAAEQAQQDAEVTDEDLWSWKNTLGAADDSAPIEPEMVEPHAYAEAVRADVREALEQAGYPDTNRFIETRSDISCCKPHFRNP